jgi:endonuclease/exonuclease/phosphatase family metal-dependent hydrolase
MGASKDDSEIAFMASVIKSYDIIAIQEVSTSPPGAQAIARLADALNRSGGKWDYRISNPTTGDGSERYAFVWNTSKARLFGKPWLADSLSALMNREPFLALFIYGSDTFLLATFHAVPKDKNPASEISKLYKLDYLYEKYHLIILGDFNLPASSDAFNSLKKRNIIPALTHQKTSLKMKPGAGGEHLASEYDNLLYENDEIIMTESGVNDFSTRFSSLKEARTISDHIPVWGRFEVKK